MDDIAPALLDKIRGSFLQNIEKNQRAAELLKQIEAGAATYAQAGDYAYEVGTALADAFAENLSSAVLPDGRMYQNIAEKVIAPMLGDDHAIVSKAAAQVQQSLNEAVGIGLKAQAADLDAERVQGIVRKVANAPTFDDAAWALNEPVKTFSQSVVDDTLRKNAEFQSKSGLRPRIIRRAESKCCEWCSRMEGVYDYPNNVPDDIYRRHERCRCLVEYDASTGKRQNVWSKRYGAAADQHYQKGDVAKDRRKSTLEARKSFADNITDHPGRLKSADPDALRAKLRGQKIRTFDLKDGGYSADLGDGKKLIYDGKGGYSLTSDGKNVWTGAMSSGNIKKSSQSGAKLIEQQSGAKKTPGWEQRHADSYYEEVRNREPFSDARKISKNIDGFSADDVEEIRQHMFIREQPRSGTMARFDSDYDQAQAWQRLVSGTGVKESDILLLNHEKLEISIMHDSGCAYEEAHRLANEKFNWFERLASEKEGE
ncbi:MAG: hypothetical protein VB055_06200 [Oscillospiraceae bacterium]|nr:hypothetical protein [Oscillospiraceae bacterium]